MIAIGWLICVIAIVILINRRLNSNNFKYFWVWMFVLYFMAALPLIVYFIGAVLGQVFLVNRL